jgi:hypothetical protein
MQRKVFLGIQALGMIQKKSPAQKAGLDHSSRLNLTLAGCSSAEPTSVSVQQCKIQFTNLYLQPVKILSHLPAPLTLTTDIKYRIASLSGESVYDPESKKLVHVITKTVIIIGGYDVMNRKFRPLASAQKTTTAVAY